MEVSVTSFKWELKSTSCCLIRFVKSTWHLPRAFLDDSSP
jgi:hypothetical protein